MEVKLSGNENKLNFLKENADRYFMKYNILEGELYAK